MWCIYRDVTLTSVWFAYAAERLTQYKTAASASCSTLNLGFPIMLLQPDSDNTPANDYLQPRQPQGAHQVLLKAGLAALLVTLPPRSDHITLLMSKRRIVSTNSFIIDF